MLQCSVKLGQMLYIPSDWYHQVGSKTSSSHPTISVNYWHDMHFGGNYVMQQFIRRMSIAEPSAEGAAAREAAEQAEQDELENELLYLAPHHCQRDAPGGSSNWISWCPARFPA